MYLNQDFEKYLTQTILQLTSSPAKVFDANILSNKTYELYIPKDLCIFNFPSS